MSLRSKIVVSFVALFVYSAASSSEISALRLKAQQDGESRPAKRQRGPRLHRRVFSAIGNLWSRPQPVDPQEERDARVRALIEKLSAVNSDLLDPEVSNFKYTARTLNITCTEAELAKTTPTQVLNDIFVDTVGLPHGMFHKVPVVKQFSEDNPEEFLALLQVMSNTFNQFLTQSQYGHFVSEIKDADYNSMHNERTLWKFLNQGHRVRSLETDPAKTVLLCSWMALNDLLEKKLDDADKKQRAASRRAAHERRKAMRVAEQQRLEEAEQRRLANRTEEEIITEAAEGFRIANSARAVDQLFKKMLEASKAQVTSQQLISDLQAAGITADAIYEQNVDRKMFKAEVMVLAELINSNFSRSQYLNFCSSLLRSQKNVAALVQRSRAQADDGESMPLLELMGHILLDRKINIETPEIPVGSG